MNRRLRALARVIGGLSLTACASSGGANLSTVPPSPDPRVGLRAGAVRFDSANRRVLEVTAAAQAAWNLRLIVNRPASEKFVGVTNSDLAFFKSYVIQGNYNGFQVWDITNPAAPTLKVGYLCPASQSDVSVYQNLLFVSGEGMGGRLDCGTEGVHDSVSAVRLRGLRIFDISDIANPKYIANVQTCRGSHTHSVVTDPNDPANVYVYISGAAPVRSPTELPGCVAASPDSNPNSARFRIEVIKVPLAAPQQAAIVSSPRIFNGLPVPPRNADRDAIETRERETRAAAAAAAAGSAAGAAGAPGAAGAAGTPGAPGGGRGRGNAGPPTGPNQCHD